MNPILIINGGVVDSLKSRKYNLMVATRFKSSSEYFEYTRTSVQNFEKKENYEKLRKKVHEIKRVSTEQPY